MGTWQKAAIVALALGAALFGWRGLRSALASDEQRVRWAFESLERGFNITRMAPAIGGFSSDYRDESTGIDRDELRQVLMYLFLRENDPLTKRFSLRLEVDEDALDVRLTGEGQARVQGQARFFRTSGGVESLFWDAHFIATLEERAGAWQIVHTAEVNVADMAELE